MRQAGAAIKVLITLRSRPSFLLYIQLAVYTEYASSAVPASAFLPLPRTQVNTKVPRQTAAKMMPAGYAKDVGSWKPSLAIRMYVQDTADMKVAGRAVSQ